MLPRLFYTVKYDYGALLMSSAAVSVGAQRLPSLGLRRFAWAVLAYFIAVILWGTLVRATGSGAGCGGAGGGKAAAISLGADLGEDLCRRFVTV